MRRIVIQDSRSFRYLSDTGGWDYEPKTARQFERVTDAAEHCFHAGLKQVHIVIGTLQSDGRFDAASKTILRLQRVVTGREPGLDAGHLRTG